MITYRRNFRTSEHTRVGPKVSGLTYKSRASWKMLREIYSAIYFKLMYQYQYVLK